MFTTKEEVRVSFNTRNVVGLKLKAKPGLVGDKDFKEFLDCCFCNFSIILITEDNQLKCKWYDEETGEIYFHFDRPIPYKVINLWFTDDEMIFELIRVCQP